MKPGVESLFLFFKLDQKETKLAHKEELIFLKLRKANRKMLVLSWKLVKYNKGNVSSSVKPKLNTLIRGNNQTIFRNRAQKLLIGKNKI